MKKYIRNLWLLLVLPVIAGLLVNWLTPIDLTEFFHTSIKWIGSLFVAKFSLPVWAIILLILCLPTLALIVKATLPDHPTKSHLNYVADTFFGLSWHWKYIGGQLYDDHIVPRCPTCKSVMQAVALSGYAAVDNVTLICHHCGFKQGFDFNLETLLDRVKREIDRKIVTGEYRGLEVDRVQ